MNANTVTSRLLGMDLEQLKRSANIEQLPLTETRRFITRIPVGGVDNFVMSGNGWKMEGVFKLTPEQTKTVDALRDEYSAEQKKLAKEIYEEELKLAQKVTDLRAKYEQKANDVLAGADKEAKQQMDALSLEIQTKITGVVKDAIELYDVNDLNQAMNFAQAMREKVNALYQSGEDRLTTLVPAEARAKIQEMMKRQTEAGQNPFGGRRGFQVGDRPMRGAGGAGAGDAGAAVQPPKAPPDQF
jgi:alanyl-tRNA synthetase